MFRKSFLKLCVTTVISLIAVSVASATTLKKLNLLEDVATSTQDGKLALNIRFKESVGGFKGPIFYPRSIQMDFLDAFIKPSKRYFPVDSSLISQVNVIQYDRKTVRIRLVLAEEGLSLKDRFHIRRHGQSLKVEIDGDGVDILDRFLNEMAEPVSETESHRIEDPIQMPVSIKSTGSKTDLSIETNKDNVALKDFDYFLDQKSIKTDSIQLVKAEPKEPVLVPARTTNQNPSAFLGLKGESVSNPPEFSDNALKMFSMLALVLGIMFVVLYFFKKFIFGNGLLGGNDQLVNVLGARMLSPRKNITLVEIAGDVLVLGVSQDHIALLATIQDKAKIEKIKKVISIKNSFPSWSLDGSGSRSTAAEIRMPSKAQETFAKYVKEFSEKTSKPSAAEVNSLIQKKLGALRTA